MRPADLVLGATTESDPTAGTTAAPAPEIELVIASRDRRDLLLATLGRVVGASPGQLVTVVDDGSTDGTAAAVASRFPGVRLLRLDRSRGASARNLGVAAARAPLVALSDDDSWWVPGSLELACRHFRTAPRLAVLAARVLVGVDRRPDPICDHLTASPLPERPELPGPRVLGFLACGAVVRRSAFLEAGGFAAHYGVGGEEELLAIDLAGLGWWCSYTPEVVAVHEPPGRPDDGRRRDRRVRQLRNALWTTWLRRRVPDALGRTRTLLTEPAHRDVAFSAVGAALRGLPWVLTRRRVVSAAVTADLRLLGSRRT